TCSVEVAGADRAGLPSPDELVQSRQRLLDRRVFVGLVGEIQVDPLYAQAAEAAVELAQDAVVAEAPVVGIAADRPEDLGAQQHRRLAFAGPRPAPAHAS